MLGYIFVKRNDIEFLERILRQSTIAEHVYLAHKLHKEEQFRMRSGFARWWLSGDHLRCRGLDTRRMRGKELQYNELERSIHAGDCYLEIRELISLNLI